MKPIDPRKGIIISYPHSGLNWVRYCIESLTHLRTPGTTRVVAEGEIAIYRTHNVKRRDGPNSTSCKFYGDDGRPIHNRVVMLLRDYRESFLRVAKTKPNYRICPENIEEGRMFNFRNYFDNLYAFHDFEGKKLLLRYHEVVQDFDKIRELLEFIDLPVDTSNFDVESHRKRSLEVYDKQHVSYTKSELKNFKWHQQSIEPKVLRALDRFVQREYPDLIQTYFPESTQAAAG